MNKILIIPDVHGTREWIKAKNMINKCDYIVALGDWFDNHKDKDWNEVNQIDNLKEFFEFKNKYSNKIYSCLGNHDMHYLFNYYGERYSGYQRDKAWNIREFLEKNCDQFKVAARIDDVVFSHAGISAAWMKNKGYKTFEEMNTDIIKDTTTRSDRFQDLRFYSNGECDLYGNEPTQTPVWIRPEALWGLDGDNLYFPHQIVGHTCYKDLYSPYLREDIGTGRWLLCCDNELHKLIEIGIEDGRIFSCKKIK